MVVVILCTILSINGFQVYRTNESPQSMSNYPDVMLPENFKVISLTLRFVFQ
jgi:hypothetical protein